MDELINALNLIRDECRKHFTHDSKECCRSCPIGNDDGKCLAYMDIPYFWKVKNPEHTNKVMGV